MAASYASGGKWSLPLPGGKFAIEAAVGTDNSLKGKVSWTYNNGLSYQLRTTSTDWRNPIGSYDSWAIGIGGKITWTMPRLTGQPVGVGNPSAAVE
jgi:hypothetical protein